jgi:hypothetical protein
LALLLRRQYEFPQCGINKGNIFLFYFMLKYGHRLMGGNPTLNDRP